jgi:hypothetical protein
MHYACQHDDLELIQMLLSRGARSDMKDNFGYTAKDYAERFGNEDIVELLEEVYEDAEDGSPVIHIETWETKVEHEKNDGVTPNNEFA